MTTAAPSPPEQRWALHVRGTVLPEAEVRDLFIVEGRVSYERVAAAPTVAGGWLVPGLVDAHCHIGIGFGQSGLADRDEQERQAVADRDGGALLLRDCGSPVDNRWVQQREDLPRLVRAGRHLARPKRYLRGLGIELEPAELASAAAVQARQGDGWVKLVGDWIDRERGDLAPVWPSGAVRAAVEAAHAAGARVTAHVFGEEALPDLIDAGIDCVEHGPGLDDTLIDRMARSGTALVPTLINIATFPGIADRARRYPDYAAHMRRLHARAPQVVRAAHEAGVRICTGTDAGGGIEHGRVVDEIIALHDAGLPAEAALAAGSWEAREWLGFPGALAEGALADFLVLADDPRQNLEALRAPLQMFLRGRPLLAA
ncbi:MAG: amidohydrolase family protein [Frankiaceae bacterium]